jgi:pimeloyl-ACP methyl ester carboxylesterase
MAKGRKPARKAAAKASKGKAKRAATTKAKKAAPAKKTVSAAHSAADKPGGRRTFVLVHGAWHGGWCWERVADLLNGRGHRVFAPTLTGLGERSHLLRREINVDVHVTDVVNVMKWERLSDVVLCGHSYGGFVISGVAERVPAAIASIVFLDAFVPDHDNSVLEITSAAVASATREAVGRGETTIAPRPAEFFRVNEKDRAWVDAMCTPQPIGTFTQKLALSGARDRIAKKTYIRARDYHNPAFDAALSRARADRSWRVLEAPCGHDVMVDKPEWLADLLEKVA